MPASDQVLQFFDVGRRVGGSQVRQIVQDFSLDRSKVLEVDLRSLEIHQFAGWAEALGASVSASLEASHAALDGVTPVVIRGVLVDVVVSVVHLCVRSERVSVGVLNVV